MRERRAGPIIAAILMAIPLMLFAGYMGSYYTLLEGVFADNAAQELQPRYHWKNMTVSRLLQAAHKIDRRVRPDYWSYK